MYSVKDLTTEEKLRLLNGVGSWNTFDCHGKVRPVTMSDGPHGLRRQEQEAYADINKSRVATCFPTASAAGCSWNREAVAAMAEALAQEAVQQGVDLVLGPGINIKRSPLCGRNFEYYSEDPYLSGELAAAFIRAMENRGVGSCVKHFACNNREKDRMSCNSVVDERTLHEIYLTAFEKAVKEGHPSAVMSSYNCINGVHASANRYLLTQLLRERWGFDGAVISDWGGAIGIAESIKAGMDLEMPDSFGAHTKELKTALEKGQLTGEELDHAVERVLALAEKSEKRRREASDSPPVDSHAAALRLATESAVLLKHSGSFPLRMNEKVLLLGDLAVDMRFQGGGSSHITTAPVRNALKALRIAGVDAVWARGYNAGEDTVDELLLAEAVKIARRYEKVIVFAGLTERSESEGYDRSSMTLPENQLSLLNALIYNAIPFSVVCFGGSPFEMPFFDSAGDILMMYLGGEAVGEACAALLTGNAVPSGHLAETWPLHAEDTPCFESFSTESANVLYRERFYVGYRYYDSFDIPVRFPFGYGLSYTSFAYRELKTEKVAGSHVQLSFTVENTGKIAGSEVVQIYVVNPQDGLPRPKKELRGFEKVFLQPGESRRVTMVLEKRDFSVYDTAERAFVVPAGEYGIAVGASVADIRLEERITLPGKHFSRDETLSQAGCEGPVFSTEAFTRLFPNGLPLIKEAAERAYELSDPFERVCAASPAGRTLFRSICTVLPLTLKGGRKDPTLKMVLRAMAECPLESLPALSGGTVGPGLMKVLLKLANLHRK